MQGRTRQKFLPNQQVAALGLYGLSNSRAFNICTKLWIFYKCLSVTRTNTIKQERVMKIQGAAAHTMCPWFPSKILRGRKHRFLSLETALNIKFKTVCHSYMLTLSWLILQIQRFLHMPAFFKIRAIIILLSKIAS